MKENIELNKQENLQENEVIVRKNIAKINTQMIDLLMNESLGGNAGRVEIDGHRFNCGGANGFLDPETGEISIFGNVQNVPEEQRQDKVGFVFRVAVDKKFSPFRILDVFYNQTISDEAKNVIGDCIKKWNVGRQPDTEPFKS